MPTQEQIEHIVAELASTTTPHVSPSAVMFLIDCRFPGLSDADFNALRPMVQIATDAQRARAMRAVWG